MKSILVNYFIIVIGFFFFTFCLSFSIFINSFFFCLIRFNQYFWRNFRVLFFCLSSTFLFSPLSCILRFSFSFLVSINSSVSLAFILSYPLFIFFFLLHCPYFTFLFNFFIFLSFLPFKNISFFFSFSLFCLIFFIFLSFYRISFYLFYIFLFLSFSSLFFPVSLRSFSSSIPFFIFLLFFLFFFSFVTSFFSFFFVSYSVFVSWIYFGIFFFILFLF